jgi:hypothetical protein
MKKIISLRRCFVATLQRYAGTCQSICKIEIAFSYDIPDGPVLRSIVLL